MVFLDADTANIIKDAMRALSYFLCEFIYELIVWMYKVFDRLCNSRILDSTALETIAERVGILLGLIMLFMVVFSVIQMVLEPDKLTDKEKGIGNILKKIILVMVMLGVSSSLFSLMYGIQKKVIASNVIQKFLLPYEVTGNESFGGVLSYNLFTSVYYYNIDNLNVEDSVESLELKHRYCYEGFNKIETLLKNGEKEPFAPIGNCVNAKSNDTYIMSFNWLLAPIIGGGVLYFIFSYCISIGIRTIQLAFLEIIAPMAIISYLSPKKDSMFSKWTKLYFATYIDVFLRIMIINLIAFLIMTILESSDKWVFWNSVGGKTGTFADKAIWILMVFALLTFAKKAPELIKDLFPSSASKLGLGVTSPKKIFDNMLGGNLVKSAAKIGTVGTAIGLSNALTSGVSRFKINKKNGKNGWEIAAGTIGGVFSGLGRGFIAGNQKGNPFSVYSKGVKAQRDLNDKYDELITSGGNTLGKIGANISANFGETTGQEYTRQIRNNEAVANTFKAIKDAAEGFSDVKKAKTLYDNAIARGNLSDADLEDLFNAYKTARKNAISQALEGKIKFTEAEDQSIAAGISVHKAELENLVNDKQVVLIHDKKDASGKVVGKERITTFNNYDSVNDASISANTNIANIKKEDDYSAAIANDKAAGVNSNGSGK